MKTFQELGIFFAAENGHEEASGICFYGFFGKMPLPANVDSLRHIWDEFDIVTSTSQIEAEEGGFLVMQVKINQWPNDRAWHSVVITTLSETVRLGAIVAWCGGETCSWSLEELNPATSSGCVYAAYSLKTGLILHSGLSDEMAYLTDEELASLPR